MSAVISDSIAPRFAFSPAIQAARLIVIKPNLGYPKQHPIVTRAELLAQVVEQLLTVAPQAKVILLEGICCKEPFELVMNRVGIGGWFSWGGFEQTGIAQGVTLGWADRVELWDADRCATEVFKNPAPAFRFRELLAPSILKQADCCVSIAPLKRTMLKDEPLYSGVIKNFFGLLPRSAYKARSATSRGQLHRPDIHQVICDVYQTLNPYFHYGIVDLHEYFVSKDWQPDSGTAKPIGKTVFSDSLLEADLKALHIIGEAPDRFHQLLMRND